MRTPYFPLAALRRERCLRAISLVLLPAFVLNMTGAALFAQTAPGLPAESRTENSRPSGEIKVALAGPEGRQSAPQARLKLGEFPEDELITQTTLFEEPLVPIGGRKSLVENTTLGHILERLSADAQASKPFDPAPLVAFLAQSPKSPWRASLQTNLGLYYRAQGKYSKALAAWEEAWAASSGATEPVAKQLADRAIGELAHLNACLGRADRIQQLLKQIAGRGIQGPGESKITGARAGLALMKNRPDLAFRCGPMALGSIRRQIFPKEAYSEVIRTAPSTAKGVSLQGVSELARQAGMSFQIAKRSPGAAFITPSVVHWKLDHYAAILGQKEGLYQVKDPTFGKEAWISSETLEEEVSGYFLVPAGDLPQGWKKVGADEASKVWGKGHGGPHDDYRTCKDSKGPCFEEGPVRMARYTLHYMTANLSIFDAPLGYAPPRGPAVEFEVTYNHRTPAPDALFNMGTAKQWTTNWTSYVKEDSTYLSVDLLLRGGGFERYTDFAQKAGSPAGVGEYAPNPYSHAILRRTSVTPIIYERTLPDGSVDTFERVTGTAPKAIYLTKEADPTGNALTLTYDASNRLTTIVDALGQSTTLSYISTDRKVRTVTDPFGRVCSFTYDGSNRLWKIQDVYGIQSIVTYASTTDNFITQMQTPYGVTAFTHGEEEGEALHGESPGQYRFVEATDPLGDKQRVESWGIAFDDRFKFPGGFANHVVSFYWDKKAMKEAPGEHRLASHIVEWLEDEGIGKLGEAVRNEKGAGDAVLHYTYANQDSDYHMGDSVLPLTMSQTVENSAGTGTEVQTWQFEYNAMGKTTKYIDPAGRTFSFDYGANPDVTKQIDLLEVRQTRDGANAFLASATYNTKHQPLTKTDASGQVTTFNWNANGQLNYVDNANGERIKFNYDAGINYLASIDYAAAGSTDLTSFLYDGFGRVWKITDSEGYQLAYEYDALDRVKKITYPDGTFEQMIYNPANLNLDATRDRLGRVTRMYYDALQQPVTIQDPLGRLTQIGWCKCGSIKSLVDGNGQTTTWVRDIHGRVTSKIFADQTKISYTYEPLSSRLSTMTDAEGQVTSYTYYVDNSLHRTQYSVPVGKPATPAVEMSYDPDYARIATVTQVGTGSPDAVTTYGYTPFQSAKPLPAATGVGRLATIDGPWANDDITLGYDALGRITNKSVAGQAASSHFDALGRVDSQTNALGTFGYAFVRHTSRLGSITAPYGQSLFTYYEQATDALNPGNQKLKQIQHKDPSATLLSQFDYTYDAAGQILTWTQQAGAAAATRLELEYDLAGQLAGARRVNAATSALLQRFVYGFDEAGNRTSLQTDSDVRSFGYAVTNAVTRSAGGGPLRFSGVLNEAGTVTVGGKPATVDSLNRFTATVDVKPGANEVLVVATDLKNNTSTAKYQVTVPAGAEQTYVHDRNGNLLSDGAKTYQWNARNELVKIQYVGSSPVQTTDITYDAFGRRNAIIETVGSTVTEKRFVWSGLELAEERDATNTPTKRFFPEGVQNISGATTENLFYTHDHLGSVREVLSNTGALLARYDYDLWGTRTRVAGTIDVDFGYTGHYYHQPSSLHLAPYRAYDATLGRWISRDRIAEAGGVNLYAYVLNMPAHAVDPLGLDIVVNNSGVPIMVSGNPGGGHGTGAPGFAVIPPDGRPYGGTANPVPVYPTREEAEIAAGLRPPGAPLSAPSMVTDIDDYDDLFGPHRFPDHCDNRIRGDEEGPTTTFTKNKKGELEISRSGRVGAAWRFLWR